MELSLDKGNTLRLLSDIYNGASKGKLKNDLISSSPLSDTVITALIVEYPLSHGNFKNVMQYNLPVSRDVSPYLNERLKTIPKGIANQLIPLMSENQFAVTPASIQRKIEYLNLEKQLYMNEIIFRLLDTTFNNKAAVVSLLEEIDTWSAKQLLFSDMLNNGVYTLAVSFLSDFDRSNSDINDWVELNEILLSLYNNNKTLYNMTARN